MNKGVVMINPFTVNDPGKGILFLIIICIVSLCPNLAICLEKNDLFSAVIENNIRTVSKAEQIIFVTSEKESSTSAKIQVFEKIRGAWKPFMWPINASVGHNGFAGIDKKKEGDRKTPSGIFTLGTAFGYAPEIRTKMPYRQATEDDFWVDDEKSEKYNRWVNGKPSAASYEKLKRDDDTYKYGIVIEYNSSPVVRGKGSAIFIHVWRAQETPTEGCIAMSEENILKLLDWLDPARNPLVIAGTESELRSMREGASGCYDLVDINRINSNIVVDIRYSTENNFTKKKVYPVNKCFLRKAAASRLDSVQKELEKMNLGLKVWDCYRPLSVQRAFWAIMPDERYVANPAKGSRHNRASAVDVTIVDASGAEVQMPTEYDDFSDKAGRYNTDLPKKALGNSRLLEGIMKNAGFIPLPSEWWHFDDKEWEKSEIMDIPFEQLVNGAGC
jgi:zinc D-Ala-D-Ala dipeptidase